MCHLAVDKTSQTSLMKNQPTQGRSPRTLSPSDQTDAYCTPVANESRKTRVLLPEQDVTIIPEGTGEVFSDLYRGYARPMLDYGRQTTYSALSRSKQRLE